MKSSAKHNPEIKRYSKELLSYGRLRNAIVHNPDSRVQPIAEPHDEVVAKYEALVERMMRPPKAREHWVSRKDITVATASDRLIPIMIEMSERSFSHVPLIRDDVVAGVLSEWTPLEIAKDTKELLIEDTQTIDEFSEWTCLKRPTNQQAATFAAKDSTLGDIKEMFRASYEKDIRLGIIFFTEHGKAHEKLLGLLTPWDVVHID